MLNTIENKRCLHDTGKTKCSPNALTRGLRLENNSFKNVQNGNLAKQRSKISYKLIIIYLPFVKQYTSTQITYHCTKEKGFHIEVIKWFNSYFKYVLMP